MSAFFALDLRGVLVNCENVTRRSPGVRKISSERLRSCDDVEDDAVDDWDNGSDAVSAELLRLSKLLLEEEVEKAERRLLLLLLFDDKLV